MWKRMFFLLFVALGIVAHAQNTQGRSRVNLSEFTDHEAEEGHAVIALRDNSRERPRQCGDEQASCPVYATECCPPCVPEHHIEIGGVYTYAYLKPDGLDHLTGQLGGLQALYEYQKVNCMYQALTFAWRQGNLKNSVDRYLLDIDTQGRLGYTFGGRCEDWFISLFTGLGYRHISHDVSSGVNLFYNTLYIPVGFTSDFGIYEDWYVGLNFQWRPQAYPTLRIDPLDGARWITECKLANFLVELPLTYVICCENRCELILKPFFEYWQDGRTTAEVLGISLGLPKNTYLFGGFSLNFRYSF